MADRSRRRSSLYVTGRLPLLVALGVVPVVLLSAAGVDAWLVAAGLGRCCARCSPSRMPRPRPIRGTCASSARCRAGCCSAQRVAAELRLRNTGARTLRGRVRDAWQPTAGAPGERPAIDIPPGESRTRHDPAPPASPRRARARGSSSSARTVRCGSPGARSRVDAVGAIRVLPPFTARRHLPSRLARLRELDGNTSVQVRGQGTEFDSLREYVRGDDVRSIDWRATARSSHDDAAHLATRARPPRRDRHRHRPHRRRARRRRRAAGCRDGGRAAARRARDPRRRPHAPPDVRPRDPRPGDPRRRPGAAAGARRRDGAGRAAADRHRLGCRVRPGARAHLAPVARGAADRAGRRRGGARVPRLAARRSPAARTCSSAPSRTSRRRPPGAPGCRRTSTAPPRPSARCAMPPSSPPRSAAPAPRRSPPTRSRCRRGSPTATSR